MLSTRLRERITYTYTPHPTIQHPCIAHPSYKQSQHRCNRLHDRTDTKEQREDRAPEEPRFLLLALPDIPLKSDVPQPARAERILQREHPASEELSPPTHRQSAQEDTQRGREDWDAREAVGRTGRDGSGAC